ncbi:MAG TPA: ArsA family ATPase [Solirubrobacteraceae bacterium]|nr:ArsA family ATPase [Solirubrobacteraceae bacterium]
MHGLLSKRLIFVCGKGGVGKSTVAAALGLAAARRAKRTILVEVARQERMAQAFAEGGEGSGAKRRFAPRELAAGLYTLSMDPEEALHEYLADQLPFRRLADGLASSRMFQYFAAAVPGMPELVTMGKVWDLAQLQPRTGSRERYDLVIVDAPATGHGVGLLRTPKTFANIARVGPVAHQSRMIHTFITDPVRTGVLAVTQAEEMPVSETLALQGELRGQLGIELDSVIVNALYPRRFDEREAEQLRHAFADARQPRAHAALRAALSEHVRAARQRDFVALLRERSGLDAVELPYVFEAQLELPALSGLADLVEQAL